jgi:hypothetical protein
MVTSLAVPWFSVRISIMKMMKLVQDNGQAIKDQFNQYNVHNAWFDVSYGGGQFGTFSTACPIEPLHSVENGFIPDCLTILFKDKCELPMKPNWMVLSGS